jgi:hypothetical protein
MTHVTPAQEAIARADGIAAVMVGLANGAMKKTMLRDRYHFNEFFIAAV